MNLSLFNDKCVRITLKDGSVFEGACVYNHAEYCEIEFGRNEECLEIADWLFYKSSIAKIEEINENNPYQSSFGIIEKEKLKENADDIFYAILSDDPRHAERLLNCIEYYLKNNDPDINKGNILKALKDSLNYISDDSLKQKIETILSDNDNN